MSARKLALVLVVFFLSYCDSGKREMVYEDFPVGQNIVFSKSTVVFNSKTECETFFKQLGDYPLELAMSSGAAFYIDQNTRASIIEQSRDTVRVLITDGKMNGFHGWTSKLFVSKVFPILPAG
ncbi:MAG: hypothetical protein HYY49_14395 [Ignavibacteriales bacterium]|nr:hypothetical protein [Ignavibacteriales bacterium]